MKQYLDFEVERLVRVLENVRPLIEHGEYTYICPAIREVGKRLDLGYYCQELIDHIEVDLKYCFDLNGWLVARYRPAMKWRNDEITECRLAWIDRMIDNLNNYGNLKGPNA